ncbi:anaerobic ribonucleoside-triphosphate reductase, partial [Candidatus Bathyarchaeota archaeon]|nr:anaerobic ribonucleoside-triphosphate reductase [Candidatus Bathyarchaeota archaeon]
MVEAVKPLPMVRSSSGHFIPWSRQSIVNSLLKETKLATMFFGVRPITEEEAESIALEVEAKVRSMDLKFVSGPLIREIVNTVLLEKGSFNPLYRIYRNVYTRVGTPVHDAYEIDIGKGFEAKENANLQPNAETAHKKKADKTSKEEYLLLMPIELADAHLKGEVHIHDLEYFGTRPFCQDWDLRYFFYYGFMPDGMGIKTSVARAAQRAEVAVLHSVKVLAAAQTNFSGGEGFYNYLVFLAPYTRGLSYDNVKQLMQMMFYELTQIYVARGGQPVFSNIQITPGVPKLWEDVPIVARGRIGPDKYGDYEDEVRMLYRALNEVALQGDYWGKPFNFPKLENGIVPELFNGEYDEEWLLAHRVVAKFGSPYFDN